ERRFGEIHGLRMNHGRNRKARQQARQQSTANHDHPPCTAGGNTLARSVSTGRPCSRCGLVSTDYFFSTGGVGGIMGGPGVTIGGIGIGGIDSGGSESGSFTPSGPFTGCSTGGGGTAIGGPFRASTSGTVGPASRAGRTTNDR